MHYSRLRRTGDAGSASRIRGARGAGHINEYGYRVLCAPDHPLAGVQGKVLEHRAVLFDAIGPGPHPCHWCERLLPWSGGAGVGINVDHLDEVRLNNELSNLVVSCLDCNTKRSRSAA